tara:strand:- start:7099 stop:10353 length:3255 start_codon:yes stop_codon:yes gene_type:complete
LSRQLIKIFVLFTIISCDKGKLFTPIKSPDLKFNNLLSYTSEFNPYTYRNFYNGGGVALGDINNDGLIDIYLTGNLVDNKMFLNKGNLQFIDITETSGLACSGVWSTGATFSDINGDGLLDLYVCKSGPIEGENRHNELFINNGNLTFVEKSKEYGLDILGLSVHSAFFDYDKDGDLDCYILNNSFRSIGGYDLIKDQRKVPDPDGQGNRLLENIGNKFIDVTEKSGIYSSNIGFGLGITLSDYNNDGWTDIFVSNDFFEKDYLYINNKNKTFTEKSNKYFKSLSLGSMGADSADLDNDLLTDLFVTEMLPKSHNRKKTKAVYDSWDKHSLAVSKGYFYQYPRNVLQRNFGSSGFFEIGRYSNLAASDWSWASMIFDLNNDGYRDIFIANGIYKDLLDRDYLAYMANQERISNIINSEKEPITKLIDIMPSSPIPNYVYKNNGEFNFDFINEKWGFETPSFSNGMSYADLDNDGDLDIVINNVNMEAFFYENNTDNNIDRSVSFELIGEEKNKNGIGAKIIIKYEDKVSMLEHYPSKGFQSSISNRLHFGVGNTQKIDSVIVLWDNNKVSYLTNLKTNNIYKVLKSSSVSNKYKYLHRKKSTFKIDTLNFFSHKHNENKFSDFNKQRLLTQMYSNEGPAIASTDLNNDGITDFFIGGAKNQISSIYLSNKDSYNQITSPFKLNIKSEDTDAVFFDSDGDGDQDLYVASGGNSFSIYDNMLNDRLYINKGDGNFEISSESFNFKKPFPTGAVSISDFNNDNLLDVFVGERFHPEIYGYPVSGHLFENLGNNVFKETNQNEFKNIGLIKSAKWSDINNDNYIDLIIAGEWMPIKIFINNNGKLEDKTKNYGLSNSSGMWNDINVLDIDNDGDNDIVAGNIGENTFFKPQMKIYINDFDKNGSPEQIICIKIDGKYFPILDKDELVDQIPSIKKKLFYYKDYSTLSIDKIFDKKILNQSISLDVDLLESSIFINNGENFSKKPFPAEINYSSVYDIEVIKNQKDILGLIIGGNQFKVKPQFGRYDASKGWYMEISREKDNFKFSKISSLNIEGEIRKFVPFKNFGQKYFVVGINDNNIKFLKINENK